MYKLGGTNVPAAAPAAREARGRHAAQGQARQMLL
jgi:hypothetical protein